MGRSVHDTIWLGLSQWPNSGRVNIQLGFLSVCISDPKIRRGMSVACSVVS